MSSRRFLLILHLLPLLFPSAAQDTHVRCTPAAPCPVAFLLRLSPFSNSGEPERTFAVPGWEAAENRAGMGRPKAVDRTHRRQGRGQLGVNVRHLFAFTIRAGIQYRLLQLLRSLPCLHIQYMLLPFLIPSFIRFTCFSYYIRFVCTFCSFCIFVRRVQRESRAGTK